MSQEQNRNAERNNLISSQEWDAEGNNVISLFFEARSFRIHEGREVLKVITEALENSPAISNSGMVALKIVMVIWKKKCEEVEVLKRSMDGAKWGEKTARRKVLVKYRMTDHNFDNHLDERENLIFFLETQRLELEKYIRDIANEFKISIPIKKQMKLFSEEE